MPSAPPIKGLPPRACRVYLVRCRDGSLYCGIADDVPRRVAQHNAGKGAKYIVPSRRPVACVWERRTRGRPEALRLEAWIKRLDAASKRALAEKRLRLRAAGGAWKLSVPRGGA